jgi:dephospho-CoA kinase
MPDFSKNNAHKPCIGLAGRIGAGKSTVAKLLEEMGAQVISADQLNRQVLGEPAVISEISRTFGSQVLDGRGQIDRSVLAKMVFAPGRDDLRQKLEAITHPRIRARRQEIIACAQSDSAVKAFVNDAPLLFEAGLAEDCDAVIFVDAPREACRERVRQARGWSGEEFTRREKMQWPLDKKRKACNYIVCNDASLEACRSQVQAVFSQIVNPTT